RSECGLHESPSFVVGTVIVRGNSADEIALDLVRDHLEDVGQVLALSGELDDRAASTFADGDATGDPVSTTFESHRLHQSVAVLGVRRLVELGVTRTTDSIDRGIDAETLSDLDEALSDRLPLGVDHSPLRVGHLTCG